MCWCSIFKKLHLHFITFILCWTFCQILVNAVLALLVFFHSTCLMLMRGWDGRPTLCPRTTCVQRMPSCWRGSTVTLSSLTPLVRPQSSSSTSTRTRKSPKQGNTGLNIQFKDCIALLCTILKCSEMLNLIFLKCCVSRFSCGTMRRVQKQWNCLSFITWLLLSNFCHTRMT